MTDSLRSEILVPARAHVRSIAVALGCGLLGLSVGIAAKPDSVSRVTVFTPPQLIRVTTPEPVVLEPRSPAFAGSLHLRRAEPEPSSELSLVFRVGSDSYLKLADVGEAAKAEPMPKHGKLRLVTGKADYTEAALASVRDQDLPRMYRAMKGRKVIVDGTCEATVTDFVVVSRLTGDTGYAGVNVDKWDPKTVMTNGAVMLAARLDRCTGTYARDASLAAIVVPEPFEDAALAAKARAAVIASTPGQDTQREWAEFEHQDNWHEHATFNIQVLRHPKTGVTWVSAHASSERGCGDAEINVWGLFRVQPDGSLAATQLRRLGEITAIEKLVDLEGDGELELIGRPWLGFDRVIARASGEELDRLSLPYFGCPC